MFILMVVLWLGRKMSLHIGNARKVFRVMGC